MTSSLSAPSPSSWCSRRRRAPPRARRRLRAATTDTKRLRAAPIVLACALVLLGSSAAPAEEIALPRPAADGDTSLEEAIYDRDSVRRYTDRPLTLGEVGQLLWSASGTTVDGVSGPTRAAASAGGLYPVFSFVVIGDGGARRADDGRRSGDADDGSAGIAAGVYRYERRGHSLVPVTSGDVRRRLQQAALGQGAVGTAPCVVVLAADYEVTRRRYGERGVERYVHMDAGHAAQNVLLQAEALDLGAAPIGAFTDTSVKRVLGIELEPLYLIPVGRPE